MKRFGLIALLSGLFAISACFGSAQVQYQDARGGVLSLRGVENEAMDDARQRMASHCGQNGYSIVKRERVVVGSEKYSHKEVDYGEDDSRTSRRSHDNSYDEREYDDGRSAEEYGSEREQSRGSVRGGSSERQVSGERDVTEMRLHYQCGEVTADGTGER